MGDYLPELVRQLEQSDLGTEMQELAVAFQIEGADRMHHGIDFIVREIVDDFDSMSEEERVEAFVTDIEESYNDYWETHSHLLEEHAEAVEEAFEEYGQ